MTLLILDDSEKTAISEYKPEGIEQKIYSVEQGKCTYVQYSLEGNNEDCARKLSAVDEYIRSNFNVTVLENDCSVYFNNKLYPLVSEFERKLRKLLYVISATNKDAEAAKNISNLEKKDFGQIFTMLFVDQGFTSEVRNVIKNINNETFTKKHFLETIMKIDENTVWDTLIGAEVVPTLRECYDDVRNIRNGIMHSQDILAEEYVSNKKLFGKIIRELDEAIGNIDIIEKVSKKKPSFSSTFASILQMQEKWNEISNAIMPNMEAIESIQKATQAMYDSPALKQAQAIYDSPAFRQAQELATRIQNIAIPPGLVALQETLSHYGELTYRLNTMGEKAEENTTDENTTDEDEANSGGQSNGENEDGNG